MSMAKKKTTSTDTKSALPHSAAGSTPAPRRRTAKKSAAETATPAPAEPVARHRKAAPAKKKVQPEVAAANVTVQEVPVPEQAPISITQEDVARLAFSYFEQRGYQGGSPEGDWLRAEEELLQLVG